MKRNNAAVVKAVIQIIQGRLTRAEAARTLGVSCKTIQNYIRRLLNGGPGGLRDRRSGRFRKLDTNDVARILACKLEKPGRSAHWIRNWLKLPVSVETVRLILVKYQIYGRLQIPRDGMRNVKGGSRSKKYKSIPKKRSYDLPEVSEYGPIPSRTPYLMRTQITEKFRRQG